jgi:hypothetical protein
MIKHLFPNLIQLIKDPEMGGSWGKSIRSTEVLLETLKRNKSVGDNDVEGKVTFKCFIKTKLAKF